MDHVSSRAVDDLDTPGVGDMDMTPAHRAFSAFNCALCFDYCTEIGQLGSVNLCAPRKFIHVVFRFEALLLQTLVDVLLFIILTLVLVLTPHDVGFCLLAVWTLAFSCRMAAINAREANSSIACSVVASKRRTRQP